jgi:PAS domain S-box-containing protein
MARISKKALRKDPKEEMRRLVEKRLDRKVVVRKDVSGEELKRLIHELKVHQIELEMQNEELRRAQVEIEEARQKYANLFDFSPVGYVTLDKKSVILELNLTGAGMLKRPRRSLIKSVFSQFVSPENIPDFLEFKRRVFETGERQPVDLKLMAADGGPFWAHLEGGLQKDEGGNPVWMQCTFNDITESKTKETELLRLAAAAEQAGEGLAIASPEGLIDYVNPAFERLTGRPRSELAGQSAYDVLAGAERNPGLQQPLERFFRGHENLVGHLSTVSAEGFGLELDIEGFPVLGPSSAVIGYLIVLRDITRRHKLEQHLRQGQKLEALGTLAGGIAHDFNNVLMPIVLNTEMALLNLPQESEVRPYLDLALAAAFRGKDMIKQIITFSRQKEHVRQPLRVIPVVIEALHFLELSLPKTIEVKRSIPDSLEDSILGDPSQVHQIVMNLLTNAVHSMREKGGVLEVRLAEEALDVEGTPPIPDLRPGKYLRLTVRDTGQGMTPEVLERVFDPFFTTKKPREGSGMGLSVVRGIVRIMGGAVTASSEVGAGSAFDIYLPKAKQPILSTETEAAKIATGKGRILVVDDEKVQLETYLNVLERLGYQADGETDSTQALARFRENPFSYDLIITDQTMPKISGLRLAEEMLRLRPGVPVLLCTGYSEVVDADQARAAGIKEFILKPFTVREIAAVVQRILAHA